MAETVPKTPFSFPSSTPASPESRPTPILDRLSQGPIGILGYGVEGESTLKWLLARGYRDITVFDRREPQALPSGVRYGGTGERAPSEISGEDVKLGPNPFEGLKTVFRSAGIRFDKPELAEFVQAGGKLTSQIETVFEVTPRERIIGVTGTLGKGTACSLLESMLDKAGIPVVLAGNIGYPALEAAENLSPGAYLLLELSSFQLSSLQQSPAYAAVLRVTSEHLDWHRDQREYWDHKSRIAVHQSPSDFLVYCSDEPGSRYIASKSQARKRSYGRDGGILFKGDSLEFVREGKTLTLPELKLKGAFNLENVAAAAALALALGVKIETVFAAATQFAGLEHRLEWVCQRDGIDFFNDSYATRPEATQGAIYALKDKPLGLILGGSEKHADFTDLAHSCAEAPHLKVIALIGATAQRLDENLAAADPEGRVFRAICPDLPSAMALLREHVPSGNHLLSPACASFGLFENYKARGKAFKTLALALS